MLPHIIDVFAWAAFFLKITSAHTWNEQFALIGSNGTYMGAYGYPRGYVARGEAGFYSQDYTIPQLSTGRTRANASDLLCHPAQRVRNQSSNYPRLTVSPGSAVAMKYLENGHVSLPQNQPGKPASGGTVFVFGTTQPHDDEALLDVLAWTSDGSGGDKRGYLLAANNYDDGRCHQINSGTISLQRQQQFPDPFPGQPQSKNELWCETNVIMPKDSSIMPVGQLFTVYWIWQWPTQPGEPFLPNGKDEYYTTCSDFEVANEEDNGPLTNILIQQDPNTLAVTGYLSRTALTLTPEVVSVTQVTGTSVVATSTSSTPLATSSQILSSSLSMFTLTVTAPGNQLKPAITPASVQASSTSTMAPMIPQINTSNLLVEGSESPTPTTISSGTPILLTAVVTMFATLQANGGVAFGGYPELVFSGASGQIVTVAEVTGY